MMFYSTLCFGARVTRHPLGACLLAVGMLTACAEPEVILPGERENVRAVLQNANPTEVAILTAPTPNESRRIALPAVRNNANWTHNIGSPIYRTAHPNLRTGLQLAWSARIGEGDSRKQRITADPVVADGRVFTLDAKARLTATSTAGATIWSRDLVPARDRDDDATGGGMAVQGGRIYVATGFGELIALNAASGATVWTQKLDAGASGPPTVFGDLVYLLAGDDTGWAVDKDTGRIAFLVNGTSTQANVLGAPAPAVTDDLAIFAFGSGEIQAVFRKGGFQRWTASVTGQRLGRSIGVISDVTSPPVVVGQTVYVGNHSGRIVSLNLGSGARNWTARDGALGPVWPAGDSIFAVTDTNELVRLDASDGSRVWAVELPNYVKQRPRRRGEVFANHGPILAGGRLIVASNDGFLRSFDPTNGKLVGRVEIPGGATTAPVVAQGTLYVVSTKGELFAFR